MIHKNKDIIEYDNITKGINYLVTFAIAVLLAFSDFRWAALWVFGLMFIADLWFQDTVTKCFSKHLVWQSIAWTLELAFSLLVAMSSKGAANFVTELLVKDKIYYSSHFAVIGHTSDTSVTDTITSFLWSVFMTEPVAGSVYVAAFVVIVALLKLALSFGLEYFLENFKNKQIVRN